MAALLTCYTDFGWHIKLNDSSANVFNAMDSRSDLFESSGYITNSMICQLRDPVISAKIVYQYAVWPEHGQCIMWFIAYLTASIIIP